MLKRMYTIYDKKAQFFDNIFYAVNDETAIRMLKNAFNQPEQQQAPFIVNPEDFALFVVGTWNDNDGTITNEVIQVTDILSLVPDNNVVELKENAANNK